MSSTPYGPSWFSKTFSYMATLSHSSYSSPNDVARSLWWHALKVISPNIINLDKHPASRTYTADSDQFHTGHHTATRTVCWLTVSKDTAESRFHWWEKANECRLVGHVIEGAEF